MKDLPEVSNVYKGGFFKNRHRLLWRAPIVGQAILDTFSDSGYPKGLNAFKVIDVGCAIGEYVNWFDQNDCFAVGIEGSSASKEFWQTGEISIHDLRIPIIVTETAQYDLAMSLEVAEHIEEEYAGIYLDNLIKLSDTILMTAAPPGQGGHGHVNCQEKEWWQCKMQNRNFIRDFELEALFIDCLKGWKHRKEINVYAKNCMIYKRNT